MAEQWIVSSDQHGAEVFTDYRHFIRRFRELCDGPDKASLQVQLPAGSTSLQRMVITDLLNKWPRS